MLVFVLMLPGRGEDRSGTAANMAALQHQKPRQQIPRTDLALSLEPEPLKEGDWLSCEQQIALISQHLVLLCKSLSFGEAWEILAAQYR